MRAASAELRRRRDDLVRHVGRGTTVADVFARASKDLRRLVPFGAAAWLGADPGTGLPTSPGADRRPRRRHPCNVRQPLAARAPRRRRQPLPRPGTGRVAGGRAAPLRRRPRAQRPVPALPAAARVRRRAASRAAGGRRPVGHHHPVAPRGAPALHPAGDRRPRRTVGSDRRGPAPACETVRGARRPALQRRWRRAVGERGGAGLARRAPCPSPAYRPTSASTCRCGC